MSVFKGHQLDKLRRALGLDDLSSVDISDIYNGGGSFIAGGVTFGSTNGKLDQDIDNFYWDDGTSRLTVTNLSVKSDLILDSDSTNTATLSTGALTSPRAYVLPDVSGPLAIMLTGSGVPSISAAESTMWWDITNNTLYANNDGSTGWTQVGGSGFTGSGVAGRVAVWSSTSALTSDAGLAYDSITDVLTIVGGITISALTIGSVLFAGVGGVISQDNINFFWDDSNNRLSVHHVMVGTDTQAAAQGDLSAGLAGGNSIFWDESTATWTHHAQAASLIAKYNSSNVQVRDLRFLTADTLRWILRVNNTAESGSNQGSDFTLLARDDTGAAAFTPLFIKRSTGFVGVGSSSVTQQLDVSGGIAANGTISTGSGSSAVVLGKASAIPNNEAPAHILWADSGTGLSAGSLALVARSSAACSIDFFTGSTTPNNRMHIDDTGMVGINTTNPDRKLDILDASNPQLRLTHTDGSVYTDLQTNSSGHIVVAPTGGVVEQRNGTSAQQFNLYNTYTDGSNYERLSVVWSSNVCYIQTASNGTGSARPLEIGTGGAAGIGLLTNGTERWFVNSTGHFLASSDNTYDIGASGTTRPRSLYLGTSLFVGTVVTGNRVASSASTNGPELWEVRNTSTGVSAYSGVLVSEDSSQYVRMLSIGSGFTTSGQYIQDSGLIETVGKSGGLVLASGSGGIKMYLGSTFVWTVNASGHWLSGANNTYDIGDSGATGKPRILYLGTSLSTPLITTPSTDLTIRTSGVDNRIILNNTTGCVSINAAAVSADGTRLLQIAGASSAGTFHLISNTNSTAECGVIFSQTSTERGIIKYKLDTDVMSFQTAGATTRWQISGYHFISGSDNSGDIGASGASRPRTGYFGTSLFAGTSLGVGRSTASVLVHLGTGGTTQGYIRLESAGASSREANLYVPTAGGLRVDTNSNSYPIELNGSELQISPGTTNVLTVSSTTITVADAKNFALNTTTGTKIGTSTSQKLGFWNTTPIAQPSSTGETTGFTAGAGTAVRDDSTFTGNVGSTAYRINDIVKHLKSAGLIAT